MCSEHRSDAAVMWCRDAMQRLRCSDGCGRCHADARKRSVRVFVAGFAAFLPPNCALVSLRPLANLGVSGKNPYTWAQTGLLWVIFINCVHQFHLSQREIPGALPQLFLHLCWRATHTGQQASSCYELAYAQKKHTQNAASETKSRFRNSHAAPAPLRHGVYWNCIGRAPDAGGPPGRAGAAMLRRSRLRRP